LGADGVVGRRGSIRRGGFEALWVEWRTGNSAPRRGDAELPVTFEATGRGGGGPLPGVPLKRARWRARRINVAPGRMRRGLAGAFRGGVCADANVVVLSLVGDRSRQPAGGGGCGEGGRCKFTGAGALLRSFSLSSRITGCILRITGARRRCAGRSGFLGAGWGRSRIYPAARGEAGDGGSLCAGWRRSGSSLRGDAGGRKNSWNTCGSTGCAFAHPGLTRLPEGRLGSSGQADPEPPGGDPA